MPLRNNTEPFSSHDTFIPLILVRNSICVFICLIRFVLISRFPTRVSVKSHTRSQAKQSIFFYHANISELQPTRYSNKQTETICLNSYMCHVVCLTLFLGIYVFFDLCVC